MDIFAVHAIGGLCGNLLTGIFAADYIAHLDGATVIPGGWLNGNWIQLAYQLADSASGMAYSFIVTGLILTCMSFIGGYIPALKLRVDKREEEMGIDDVEIGEFAYDYVELIREVKPGSVSGDSEYEAIGVPNTDHSRTAFVPRDQQAHSYPLQTLRGATW